MALEMLECARDEDAEDPWLSPDGQPVLAPLQGPSPTCGAQASSSHGTRSPQYEHVPPGTSSEHRPLKVEESIADPSSLSLPPAAAPCTRTPTATEGSVTPDEDVPLADAYAEAMHLFHLALPSRTQPPWQ